MDKELDHIIKSNSKIVVVLAGDHGTGKTFLLNRYVR
jgi:hypothetical protein